MFFALCMIALAMLLGSRAMGFGSVLVMFGRLIVLVSSHWVSPIDVEVNQWQQNGVSIGSVGTVRWREVPDPLFVHRRGTQRLLPCSPTDFIFNKEETMVTTVDTNRETVSLIGSDKVDGTAVYGADERKIGSVQRVMIDKISGKVTYAVISFGGFLGMGEDYYPMPWTNLKYDTRLGGYRVGVTEDQLKGAPKYNRNTDWDWSDRARDKSVYDYYKTPLWY
jgi:hypothetical protein